LKAVIWLFEYNHCKYRYIILSDIHYWSLPVRSLYLVQTSLLTGLLPYCVLESLWIMYSHYKGFVWYIYAEYRRYKKCHVNGIFFCDIFIICCRCAVHCCTNLSSDSTTQIIISG
jgi:hypothetical protein